MPYSPHSNLRDRISDLRELALANNPDSDSDRDINDNNASDQEMLDVCRETVNENSDFSVAGSVFSSSESLFDYSSGSGKDYVPDYQDLDSDDSYFDIDDVLPSNSSQNSESVLPITTRPTMTVPTTTAVNRPARPTTVSNSISHTPGTNGTNPPINQNQNDDPSNRPWVRTYPTEEPMNIEERFTVRNPGPRDCPYTNNPVDYFKLFITPGMVHSTTRETNLYANTIIEQKRNSVGGLKRKSRLRAWKNVTEDEMRKFLAIVINMGLTRRKNIADYWDTNPAQSIPWYGQIMSLVRFQAIHAMLHLSSIVSPPRGQPGYDPWAKVRPFLDSVNAAFKHHYVPHQDLSIDESMVGMKNRCTFIVYMPQKRHARYGIKKFEIVDSKTSYVIHSSLYSGRDFLQEGPEPFTEKVVVDLLQKSNCLGKGYHIFTDNFYTKLPLARRLLAEETYLTGTINKRSKELSQTVLGTKLNPQQSVYFRKGPVLLVGYKQKPTRKPVYLISTAGHAEDRIIRSKSGAEATKPLLIDTYNMKMGGVDCKDKSIFHVSCTRPTRRYWKKIFFNLLDMCLLNSYILYKEQTEPEKPMTRKAFLKEIVVSLSATAATPQRNLPRTPPGPSHCLEKMTGKKLRACNVCGYEKGRTSMWCPGCNVGVHKYCFDKLEHYWRPTHKGSKKRVLEEDSE